MSLRDLLTPDGQELLASLPAYDSSQALAVAERLKRDGHPAELISEALTQSRLRQRAEAKFGSFARNMLFTPAGLEQATRLPVAGLHAQRFKDAGAAHVADFGSGIGADSLAFAGLGMRVSAIEMDQETVTAASFNLNPFPEAEVIEEDGFSLDLNALGADAIWIDPARRRDGKRILDPQQWQPSLDQALELARDFKAAGIKVAPGIDYAALPEDAFVEWTSVAGDLVEAVIWLGAAAPKPGRGAVLITGRRSESPSEASQPDAATGAIFRRSAGISNPTTAAQMVAPREIGKYIFEPDPAIIRSGAISSISEEFEIAPVAEAIAYLTGDEPISSPWLAAFEVVDVLPMDAKLLRTRLADLDAGSVEIKKRGVDLDPEALRKKLKLNRKAPGRQQYSRRPRSQASTGSCWRGEPDHRHERPIVMQPRTARPSSGTWSSL